MFRYNFFYFFFVILVLIKNIMNKILKVYLKNMSILVNILSKQSMSTFFAAVWYD